jgi:hypothetical protein
METSHLDLTELRQLVADLKTDRAAQKEKERREAWTKYVSVTLVLVAVLAATATQKGGGLSTKSLRSMNEAAFKQSQATDEWAYYQAKSTKRHLYEIEHDRAQASGQPTAPIDQKIAKYEHEAGDIKAKAEALEKDRDRASQAADLAAGLGKEVGGLVSLLQIAVACGSICLVIKKKPLWFVSLALTGYAAVRLALILAGLT